MNLNKKLSELHRKAELAIVTALLSLTITYSQDSVNNYRVVDKYGQLKVDGLFITNQKNDKVILEGMSFFWSQWIPKYYNYDCIAWLRDDWHIEIIRAALAVEADGYIKYPEKEKAKITDVIRASIDLGLYVIVDWHSHTAESNPDAAIKFFSEIAREYGSYPNIIYEIYNEPLRVSWDSVVKPYCEKVISAIRKYDPDNIIVVGTPSWSQDVDVAADNPIADDNIVYALHFYAGTHKQWLRDKADYAMSKGLAIWVTEFGTCYANGNGPIDYDEMDTWFDYLNSHKISWCNWSVADKKETASALKPRANRSGRWNEEDLSESGKLIRNIIRSVNP